MKLKMSKFIKNNFKYFVVFILVILIYEFFGFALTYGDPLANYGFSYAINRGEIPYRDFNTVSTPLYAFYGSIGLLFWNNYLMFIISHALLVSICFYFLNKLYNKKSYLILAILIGLNFYGLLATYNFMCFFMMVIILYLEDKYKDKDYLIGFFIGLAILSKHTVGCFFILPTFIKYFGNWKKIGKRAVGCLVPCLIFFCYLIINKALFSFIDLCFLGLFDFSSSNGNSFTGMFYFCLIFLLIGIYFIYLNRKDIKNYYLIFSFFFAVPIFDFCHFPLFCAGIFMMVLPYLRWNDNYNIILCLTIIMCSLIASLQVGLNYDPVFTKSFKHFEYTLHARENYERSLEVNEFLNSYKDAVVLSYFTMQYDIINDRDLDYYNVMLYGNFGYDGVRKMIDKLKSYEKQIFIVNMNDYENNSEYSQFAKDIVDYVLLNGDKIDSKYEYDVYYIE